MNQNLNEEIIIHAKLRDNPQCITLEFKSRYSEQISAVFERGFEGFRQRMNQEIFLPDNKLLFILTNQQGNEQDQTESVGEGLQIENNISLVYFDLKSKMGQSDKTKNRIDHLQQQIQGLEEQVQIIYFNPDIEKKFKFQIQEQRELGQIEFKFACSGNEQTIYQLKKKALEIFVQQFPNMEILVEFDYFTIKNDISEYGINDNHQLVCELFQMQSEIELLLCLTGPINNDQLQKQFGKLFYKLVVMGQNITYVFQKFYQFIQTRGLQLDDQQVLAIENKIIEASVEELQLTDIIKQNNSDFVRQFAQSAIKFAKKVSLTKIFLNTTPHVCRGLRVITIFACNLEFASSLSQGIAFSQLVLSPIGFIIGGIALAAEIGYLIYHRDKFTNSMFYKRIGTAVGKQAAALLAYCGGVSAGVKLGGVLMAFGMPTLMPVILGMVFGVGLAFISLYCFEKLLNYFWGREKQIVYDINFLNDYDKNKCYFSALDTIGCQELTPTSEIKKQRLKKLKELHPDRQIDKRDEFIRQFVAYEIVLSFRGERNE